MNSSSVEKNFNIDGILTTVGYVDVMTLFLGNIWIGILKRQKGILSLLQILKIFLSWKGLWVLEIYFIRQCSSFM